MATDDNAASVRARAREPGLIQTKGPGGPAGGSAAAPRGNRVCPAAS